MAEFFDVVMHDDQLEYRLEQIEIGARPQGRTLRDIALHEHTGALLLALRAPDGRFLANPDQETPIGPGSVLIALGTPAQLASVRRLTHARGTGSSAADPAPGEATPGSHASAPSA